MKNIYIYPTKLQRRWKIIFLFILHSTFIIQHSAFSQTAPGIEWAKCYGGTFDDYALSIRQATDGGYIITGAVGSNDGDVSGNHGGQYDGWVAKADTIGNLQWQRCLGGTDYDQMQSIHQTTDSGYILGGVTISNDGDVSGNHGGNDSWLVKTDSNGNIEWQRCYGGSESDWTASLELTPDGGYIIACSARSNDGDVSGNHGLNDYWVVKTDSSGNIEWQKCFGGTGVDIPMAIKLTPDGGYIVAGRSNSNDGNVTGNHGDNDYWVVKTDSIGNMQWQKCYGGTVDDWAWDIWVAANGGYIVTGRASSIDGDITGSHGGSDNWVVKTDNLGNIQWQKCYGGSGADLGSSIQQTQDNGYIIAAQTYSNDGNVSGNHGSYDYWVIKTDSNGNIQWQKCLGGQMEEAAFSVLQTADSGYIVSGYAQSIDGDVTGNHDTTGIALDIWIVKLFPDTITGISQLPQLPNYPITISPNPLTTQSKLTFKNSGKEKFLFTLYDITGRITESVSTTNNEIILTKDSKQPGVYLFNLVNEKTGERMNGKIVVSD